MGFSGAKVAIFIGQDLLVIRRDDRPDIPYPDHWDLPGGGREGGESPKACAVRETSEEVGLHLSFSDLIWSTGYLRPRGVVWFFAAHLNPVSATQVSLGPEGQYWTLMSPTDYCRNELAVPHFATQLRHYLTHVQNQAFH